METVVKAYVSLFVIGVLAALVIAVSTISIQGKNAAEYADSIATLWQESNYTLTEDDFKDYLPKGYSISFEKTRTTAGVMKLSYYFDVPILGLKVPEDTDSEKGKRVIVRTVR